MSLISLLPILIVASGFYILVKIRFFFISHPIKTFCDIRRIVKNKRARKSLSLALAGTLGVGNIVGVAHGLISGGVGVVFWIFVSSVFSSALKYAESSISMKYKEKSSYGMISVIKKSFSKLGVPVSIIYALLCLALSFVLGGALQSESLVEAGSYCLNLTKWAISLIFLFVVFLSVINGSERIDNITAAIIPLSTIVYITLCLAIMLLNIGKAPEILRCVISDAFSLKGILFGFLPVLSLRALREGFSVGLLSNEAGSGTSAFAQTRADLDDRDVGLLGVVEVFFDTALLCSLTGLAVLFSGYNINSCESGLDLVFSSFAYALGEWVFIPLFWCVPL